MQDDDIPCSQHQQRWIWNHSLAQRSGKPSSDHAIYNFQKLNRDGRQGIDATRYHSMKFRINYNDSIGDDESTKIYKDK